MRKSTNILQFLFFFPGAKDTSSNTLEGKVTFKLTAASIKILHNFLFLW